MLRLNERLGRTASPFFPSFLPSFLSSTPSLSSPISAKENIPSIVSVMMPGYCSGSGVGVGVGIGVGVAAAVSCGGATLAPAPASPPLSVHSILMIRSASTGHSAVLGAQGNLTKKKSKRQNFRVSRWRDGRHVFEGASRTKMSRIGTFSSPAAPRRVSLGLGLEFLPANAQDKYDISV